LFRDDRGTRKNFVALTGSNVFQVDRVDADPVDIGQPLNHTLQRGFDCEAYQDDTLGFVDGEMLQFDVWKGFAKHILQALARILLRNLADLVDAPRCYIGGIVDGLGQRFSVESVPLQFNYD
jgi:hypothetical protein